MANSLMITCAKLGLDFTACSNKKYFPSEELVEKANEFAEESGGSVTLTESVEEACTDADIIYTDVWVSMGEPEEAWKERIHDLLPYQVNANAFSYAKENAVFMHCLPAFHDLGTEVGREINKKYGLSELEVTNQIFESSRSIVFDEAENRMHSIKAIMYATLVP